MITKKDWQIINAALALYQAEVGGNEDSCLWDIHKEDYGNPEKTIEATRERVHQLMATKEIKP